MAAARVLARIPTKLRHKPVWTETLMRVPPLQSGAFKFVRNSLLNPSRSYSSQVDRLVLDEKDSIVQRLDSEIEYEIDRSPPHKPPVKYNAFTLDEKPGEQWMCLRSRFGDNENIKIEVTMFDASPPAPKITKDKLGEDVQRHITFIVNISKGVAGEKLEFLCSAWADSIEIRKVDMHNTNKLPSQTYMGPLFKDLDDQLQNAFYYFLEERGITDDLAVFLHDGVKKKEKFEYIQWLGSVKSYI